VDGSAAENSRLDCFQEAGTLSIEDTPDTYAETCWRDVYDLELQVSA
jgi:hypothetical protein